MASGHETLVVRLDRVERELVELRRRLASLERSSDRASPAPLTVPAAGITPVAAGRPSTPDAIGPGWLSGYVALTGRTFLVLAGAFLLRAVTDGGYLPALAGAGIGLVYAAVWLLAGDQAARAGQRLSGNFYGFAAAAIAFPLIWETTTRMGQMSTEASAVALAAYLTVGLALAWSSDLQALAWITTLFALATAVVLLITTRTLATYGLVLLLLAAWTEVMAVYDRWPWLRVLPALGAGAAVFICAYLLAGPQGAPSNYPLTSILPAMSLALLLPTIYVTSLLARTIWRRSAVSLPQVLLVLVALASGLGGGTWMLAAQESPLFPIGVIALLFSACCYVATWQSAGHRDNSLPRYHALAGLGLLLAMVGTGLLLSGSALALLWSALALALGVFGGRYRLALLSLHGSAFLLGASLVSGLAPSVWDALTAAAAGNWRPLAPAGYVVAVAAAIGYALLLPGRARPSDPRADLPYSLVIAAILGWILVGLIIWGLAGLAGAPGAGADAAVLATLRTAALATMTVILASVGPRWGRHELIWLAYSLLALGAAKLLFEDFRIGRPATLFLSLALYGAALLLSSRLVKQAARRREGAVS